MYRCHSLYIACWLSAVLGRGSTSTVLTN